METTIERSFEISGIGLHSGTTTCVRVLPAKAGEGRYFVRVDLLECPSIPARVEAVRQTALSTELATAAGAVGTVEHLLAALAGSGVDNARIEIDGAEVPLLDGSAKVWTDAIAQAGIIKAKESETDSPVLPFAFCPLTKCKQAPPSEGGVPYTLTEPIWIQEGDSFVAALPTPEIRFTYGIDFPYQAIGNQWHSWSPVSESFVEAIAPARTFGFADQIEQLRQAGLIKGGSLENALVCDRCGWLNPPLRFANEPVRHKLLDLVGDLSLLGTIPVAHFLAYKASHKLHVQLAKALCTLALSSS